MIEKINPWEWRPKGIDYKVNYNSSYKGYLSLENTKIEDMKILFAIDGSGSTFNNFYKTETKKIMEKYYLKKRDDIIYRWGSEIKKYLTKEELFDDIDKAKLGGTESELIVKIIKNEKENNCKHLIIITDGCVSENDIISSDKAMNQIRYNFEYVTVFIIGKDGDLSVGAPFCRNTPNKTLIKENGLLEFKEIITLSKENIKTLKEIDKYDNYIDFMNNFNKILNAVQAQCIGTSENKELESKIELIFKKINEKGQIENMKVFKQNVDTLLSMTRGSLQKTFTLEKITAAIKNYEQ